MAAAAREISEEHAIPSGTVRLGFWFAQAARFYGWGWPDVRTLTVRQLQRFLAYLPELQARERLEESLVAAFPYLERGPRQELRHQWLLSAGFLKADDPAHGLPRVPWSQVRSFLGAKPGGHA